MVKIASDVPEGFDVARMMPWVHAHVGPLEPPVRVERLTGGRSNLTYRVVDRAGRQCVLRRPPMGDVLPTAHDMGREYRILTALGSVGFRVPQVFGHAPAEGDAAEFYGMEYVEGQVLEYADDAQALSEEARHTASNELVDTLLELHSIDPITAGLGDLSRRTGYLERQLRRWRRQWELTRTEDVGRRMDDVYRQLSEYVPPCDEVRVVHGDYRPGNCVFGEDGRLHAVLDWELCTLGDPLADVGYLALTWEEPSDERPLGFNAPTTLRGFLTRRHALDRYADRSERDLTGIDYYVAFQAWRMACINQGVYARYLSGDSGIPATDLDRMRTSVDRLAGIAAELLETSARAGDRS